MRGVHRLVHANFGHPHDRPSFDRGERRSRDAAKKSVAEPRTNLRAALLLLVLVGCPKDEGAREREPAPERLADLDLARGLEPDLRASWAAAVGAAFVDVDRVDRAAVLLERAEAAAFAIATPADREEYVQRIAHTWARAGSIERAAALAEKLPTRGGRAAAMVAAIVGAAEGARPAEARQLLEGALLDADGEATARLAIAKSLVAANRINDAVKLADANTTIRDEVLAEVAKYQAQRRRPFEAASVTEQIESAHWRGVAEAALAEAHLSRGRSGRASKTAKSIASAWMQARAWAQMTVIATKKKRHGAARRYWKTANRIVDGIEDRILRSSAKRELVETHVLLRRFDEAFELAKSIEDTSSRGAAFVALLAAAPDDHLDAILAEAVKSPLYAEDAVVKLAERRGKQRNRDAVLAIARRAPTPDGRARALAALAVAEEKERVRMEDAAPFVALLRGQNS